MKKSWKYSIYANFYYSCYCSVTKLCQTLWLHGLWHARLLCPPLSPRVCSNSHPLSWWCLSTISSSIAPFPFCPPSFPASGSFHEVEKLACLHQMAKSIGASASVNIQGWFPLGLTGLIPLQFKGLSRIFSSTTIWKHKFFSLQPSLWSNCHIHMWLLEKPWLWLYGPLSAKWCLCFLIHSLGLS